jgi:hypothetical protein
MLIRRGSEADVTTMADLMFLDPLPEGIALARSVDNARRFEVEDLARGVHAAHLSLTTGSKNPAGRLYERHGFEVVRERTGRRCARLTGIPGRVLMVKALAGARAEWPT